MNKGIEGHKAIQQFYPFFHSRRFLNTSFMSSVKEISIPVPWGKIAGKWWGSTNCKPILCFHGLRDNCGSFDKLLPLLSINRNISFLALDLPGHGFSSPFPRGMIYNFQNYIILVQLIYDYFNVTKLSFLGHSLGAMISFITTLVYPEKVDFSICIDALQPLKSTVSQESVRKSVDEFMKYNQFTGKPPSYTWEELLAKMDQAYTQSLDKESILCLLRRNIAPSKETPEKYHFTSDPMLKVRTMFNWPHDQIVKDAASLNKPILLLVAKQTYAKNYREKCSEIVETMRRTNKDFSFEAINGPHHLHLSVPEEVASFINTFLDKHYKPEISNFEAYSIFCDTHRSNQPKPLNKL